MFKVVVPLLFSLLLCAAAVAGEDVSREAPETYTRRLEPLLTPADEMLKHRADFPADDEPAIGLLHETLRWVGADGATCLAVHEIKLARDDQGIGRIGRTVFPFRKSDQKVHLLLARSIQPDGTSQNVAANAAFIQSPQDEGDGSFSDYAQLSVVFPSVRPNTACESIIVLEEPKPRMAGEFTAVLEFGTFWPEARVRHVVEMEGAVADRLVVSPLGSGVPAPKREAAGKGVVRMTWQADDVAKSRWEPERAPFEQVGPAVFLSTVKDWEAFGRWYNSLLQGRDAAGKDLAREVASRTQGISDSAAVVAALLTAAAHDVRYTGLEFGISGLQPYDPNDVWSNRYGDCKDKANLLRVMLKEKQVPAYLAMVNTEHAGRIDRRSPDYRQFNHMIVAVAQPGGGYLFCDPTIKYAKPGMLRPDDMDRDVLVLKDDGVEFVHTPAPDAGSTSYDFDLKLGPDGSLAGWLTVRAEGYMGATFAEYFSGKDRTQSRDRALLHLQAFYRAAELIDLDPMPMEKFTGDYQLRAYFTVRGSGPADRTHQTLQFPAASSMLPEFGDSKTRQTDFWQMKRSKRVTCTMHLPAGWSATDLPRPFDVESAPVAASASWQADGPVVTARLEYTARVNRVPVEQYPLLYAAVSSLRSWMNNPLSVGPARGDLRTTATAPSTQPGLGDFPLMSSGEGQLELIERRFPLSEGAARRREALLKVLQWFPDDKTSQFVANFRLLELDQKADPKNPAVLEKVRQLLDDSRSGVDRSYFAWGEYIEATWLAKADRTAEALAIFTRLAADASLPAYRRAWSSVFAASLMKDDESAKAVALLDGTLDLDSEALPAQYAELSRILLKHDQAAELETRLRTLVQRYPQWAEKILASLCDEANRYVSSGQRDAGSRLIAVLDRLIHDNPALAPLGERLATARKQADSFKDYDAVVAMLKSFVADHRPAWWDATPIDPSLNTARQFRKAFDDAAAGSALEPYLKYGIEYLTRFQPAGDEFGTVLWQMANSLQARKRDPQVLAQLLDCLERLPETDRWRYEGIFLRAEQKARGGDPAGAVDLVTAMSVNPNAPRPIRYAAYRRCGELLEGQKKYADALAMYRKLEDDPDANRRSCDGLLRAVLLNLETGDRAEALRVCGVLARVKTAEVDASPNAVQIREILHLAADPSVAEAFWKRQEKWWPLFLRAQSHVGPALGPDDTLVPLIPNPKALGEDIGTSFRAASRERFFQDFRVLAHAARWFPTHVIDLGQVAGLAAQLAQQQHAELLEVAVEALRGFDMGDRLYRETARTLMAALLIDSQKPAEALAVVKQYVSDSPPNDANTQAMHRIWVLSTAEPKELDGAIAALKADLAGAQPVAFRAKSVDVLAQAYRKRGRAADELALLKEEVRNPAVLADAPVADRLNARYQDLLKNSDQGGAFAAGVERWLRDHKPAWYDYAKPASLKEFGDKKLRDALASTPRDMPPPERAKLWLLVAQDPSQPYPQRVKAFQDAVFVLVSFCARHDQVLQLCSSVYDDKAFPEETRRICLWMAMLDGPQPTPAALRENPLTSGFNSVQRQWLDGSRLPDVDEDSARSLEDFASRLLQSPLNATATRQLRQAFTRLLQLDTEAGRRVYGQTAQMTLTPDNEEPVSTIRLELLRQMKAAEKNRPRDQASRDLAMQRFASDAPEPPADWEQYENLQNLDSLEARAAFAIRRHALKTRRADPGDMNFWEGLLRTADPNDQDQDFRTRLVRTLVTTAAGDEQRWPVVLLAPLFVDIDRPECLTQLRDILEPYRDPGKNPATSAIIRLIDAQCAIRTGQPPKLDDVTPDAAHPMVKSILVSIKLTAAMQSHDRDAIRQTLERMPPDQLLEPNDLPRKLAALEAAGMNDEAALLREAGRKALYTQVLATWAMPLGRDVVRAIETATALGLADEIPAAWADDCLAAVRDEQFHADIRLGLAELHHDWAGALAAADVLLATQPMRYHCYWSKGRALFELGRKAEAADALKTYVRYSKDEIEYPKALVLLEKLGVEPR